MGDAVCALRPCVDLQLGQKTGSFEVFWGLLTCVQRMYGLTALACLISFDMPVYFTLR